MFAEIQGSVIRTELVGDLRLTESTYQPESSIGAHSHRCAVFGLILRGHLQQKSSMVTLSCPSGSVFYNPPEIPHTNRIDAQGARCVYIEIAPQWLKRAELSGPPMQDPVICPDSRIQLLARRIYAEWLAKDDLTALMMEGLSCELIAEVFRAQNTSAGEQSPAWLTRVRDLLRSRFADPPSLCELSVEAGVHRVHVARQFRKHYGTTIGEFVRQTRIEYARRRLCNTDLSTVEIALESGFAHQAHFSNVFKKVMGMTPGQYCAAMGVTRRRRAGLPVVAMPNHYSLMKGFKGRDLAS